jgi:hypothetical protein
MANDMTKHWDEQETNSLDLHRYFNNRKWREERA